MTRSKDAVFAACETHTEFRWALSVPDEEPGDPYLFLGKFCWCGATGEEPAIRTFRTRREAREAKKVVSYPEESRVEKVAVIVVPLRKENRE